MASPWTFRPGQPLADYRPAAPVPPAIPTPRRPAPGAPVRRGLGDILNGLPTEPEIAIDERGGVAAGVPTLSPEMTAAREIQPMSNPGALDAIASAPLPAPRRAGIFDRIGDFLASDEGRAALLRSGAATMQGGLGAGIQAGAEFMDGRRTQAEETRRWDLMQALRERGVDIDQFQAEDASDRGWGQLGIQEGQLGETRRSNRAREGLEARGQDVQRYGIDTNAAVNVRGQDNAAEMNAADNDVARYGIDRRAETDIYGTNMNYRTFREGLRGSGANAGGTHTIRRTTPAAPERRGWFSTTPAQPEVVETTERPLPVAGGAAPAAQPASGLVVGQIVEGYRYKGGDPNLESSWEPA